MGKNHQHKKQVKSEKSKIKLKVKNEKTKFLPKGLNVTNTTFKIKPIVLSEQLKISKDALLSKRKLNIKELSSRLKHHNLTVKQDSCEELKQLFISHQSDIINQHLSELLHAVAPLLLDKERKIRRAAINIFEKLFEKAPVENIEAFFLVLSSYLRCSMTNIDRFIQEDSLLFLDVLLKYTPKYVANNSEKILPNLFALISKFRNDAKPGRTLTVNLGSKLTNIKWRIQVLSRLYTFLNAVINNEQCNVNNKTCTNTLKYAADSNILDITYDSYKNIKQINKISVCLSKMDDENVITKNMSTIMSLMYEIWLEVQPEKSFKEIGTENTTLNSDTASILSSVLNIIYLLLQHQNNNYSGLCHNKFVLELLSTEGEHFLKYILNHFPFSQQHIDRKKKDKSDAHNILAMHSDPRCVRENLLICYLFCLLNSGRLNGIYKIKEANNVLHYVTNCLLNRNIINEWNAKYLILVVRTILLDNFANWRHSSIDNLSTLLDKFVCFYETTGRRFKCSHQMFDILCEISQMEHLNKTLHYRRWLQNLSNVLYQKQVPDRLLDSLLLLSKQNNELFQQGLVDNMLKILDNYEQIEISNCNDAIMSKRKILFLYFYVANLDKYQQALINSKY